jgi:hypothetical protein
MEVRREQVTCLNTGNWLHCTVRTHCYTPLLVLDLKCLAFHVSSRGHNAYTSFLTLQPNKWWVKDETSKVKTEDTIISSLVRAITLTMVWWDVSMEQWWGHSFKKLKQDSIPLPLPPPWISNEVIWDWTRDSTVRSQLVKKIPCIF